MATRKHGHLPARNEPKFTIDEAAQAFREARGAEAKVEFVEESAVELPVPRASNRRLALVPSTPPGTRRAPTTRKKPTFTVEQAAEAFRKARGDRSKVGLVETAGEELSAQRSAGGRLV